MLLGNLVWVLFEKQTQQQLKGLARPVSAEVHGPGARRRWLLSLGLRVIVGPLFVNLSSLIFLGLHYR